MRFGRRLKRFRAVFKIVSFLSTSLFQQLLPAAVAVRKNQNMRNVLA
jgi:ABC-type transport system involved in cytochrome bd biosynthesis fused ATPase/permease subunit